MDAVEAYLAAQPEPQQRTLRSVRATLVKLLPHAEECIKYGVPALALGGKGVAGYAGFAKHCAYLPMSGSVIESAGSALDGYTVSKGAVQFPIDRPLPAALLRRLVRLRLDEAGAVTDGKRVEYFDDGRVKAEGAMKAGELHGAWRWYRKDGSLLRTGSFRHGEQTGTWQTYDADGNVLTTKRV
jgi:uncharacterized protein YdhG (YjbR/CyaY superfamily)